MKIKFWPLILGFWLLAIPILFAQGVSVMPGGGRAATQVEVDAGTISNKFVSPLTLAGYGLLGNTNALSPGQSNALANAVSTTTFTTTLTTTSNVLMGLLVGTNVWAQSNALKLDVTTFHNSIGTNQAATNSLKANIAALSPGATNAGVYLAATNGTVYGAMAFPVTGSTITDGSVASIKPKSRTLNSSTAAASLDWNNRQLLSAYLALDWSNRTLNGPTDGSTVASWNDDGFTVQATNTAGYYAGNAGGLTNVPGANVLSAITNVTTTFTIPVTVNFVTATSSSSSFTNTLPASPPTGYSVIVKRTGANIVYVKAAGSDTIDGSTAAVALNTAVYETRGFVWDGSTWWIW